MSTIQTHKVRPGATSEIINIWIPGIVLAAEPDAELETVLKGVPTLSVDEDVAGLVGYYIREGTGTPVAMTFFNSDAGFTPGTYAPTTGNQAALRFYNDTNLPGLCEFHIPNNVIAQGACYADISLHFAALAGQVIVHLDMEPPAPFAVPRKFIKKGTRNYILTVPCPTANGGFLSSGTATLFTIAHKRSNQADVTSSAGVAATAGTWTSYGVKVISDGLMEIGIPDVALAAARSCDGVDLIITADSLGMAPVYVPISLVRSLAV